MNRFNEDDTLQLSAPARKRKSLSELTLTSWDLLSEEQKERRRMVRHIIYQADSQRPRKSILKTDAYEPEDTTSMSAINASMSTSARGAARKSVGISRRVSFAPSAHVRMGTLPSDKERRRKSVGSRRGSLAAPGSVAAAARRSSIQVMQSNPISPRAARPAQTQPRSPLQRYFVGEGEDQGEESMEMSEDESDMEIEVSLEPSALQASADESYGTDEEMDMEETAVLGAPWPAASQEEEDEDEEMDMTVSDVTFSGDEEKTMDFTVALGSGLPNVPPQDARHNRRSIGYLNPGAGEEEPLRPGDDTESSMMMETAVYGTGVGVVYADDSLSSADEAGHSDPERHTMTFNYGGGDMEFTSVVGGVGPDESGMELTVAVGGIHGVPDDGTVMQFTTVVGGIHDGAAGGDTTAMEFTMAVGGIHQPATTTMTTNIFDTTTTRRNIFAPDDYLAGHTATQAGLVFPVMEPARITAIDDSVSPGADAASASGSGEPTPAPPTRVRGSSATPARKTPTATPGFMRPTAASAKKEKAGKTPAAAPATATTTTTGKKKNPFAPSPDSPGLQRSKSRTPGSGATSAATSVAQRLFTPGTPSAAANVFSTTPRKATTGMPKAATPKAATPKAATPKAATPKSAAKSTKITPRKKTPSKTPGAAPSSATPKRPRGEDTQTTGKKRNIFAPDSTNRSRTLGQPEVAEDAVDDMLIEEDASPEPAPAPAPARPTSSYTPIRNRPSLAARASLAPPVRIPTPAKAAAIPPPSPRYGVEDEEEGEDEPAQITLAAFLEMTDTQFNDNFAVSERRQSLAYGLGAEEREYALSDFVDANVESVYVNTFKWMIDKMKIDIHEMGENVRAAEAMLSTNNPSIVRVYLSANEKDRPLFNQMLRGHRENAKLNARRDWFKDKYNTLDKIRPAIEHIHKEMTDDSDKYRVNLDGASKLLPDLRARHAELKAELERHRAEVQLIEECDKDELHELKHGPAGVVEQEWVSLRGTKLTPAITSSASLPSWRARKQL
jgi:hypothetical protein